MSSGNGKTEGTVVRVLTTEEKLDILIEAVSELTVLVRDILENDGEIIEKLSNMALPWDDITSRERYS